MILHIVHDDKFIDMAYNMFEKAEVGNNEFMVVTEERLFQHIKTTPITKISEKDFFSKRFSEKLEEYEFVVLHWLDNDKMKLIQNTSELVKFIWIGWGGDYYNYIGSELLLPSTESLKRELSEKGIRGFIKKVRISLRNKIYKKNINNISTVMNKINYFAPVLSTEYDLVARNFNNFKPKFIDWNYGAIEDNLIGIFDADINGNNILVGNSATYENNHIEIFDTLKNLELGDRKIITPLSYGDDEYALKILEIGKKDFENFTPLVNFMELSEYNKIISTSSVVIMNHLRQQALSNITVMMYLGAKIFLNKENPAYSFYLNKGAIIFNMEELTSEAINIRLEEKEVKHNRKVLLSSLNHGLMLKKTISLIETLKNATRS